ncbi:hypothetical protein B0O80DRAFT_499934 [Mortierella sp. GBAus27b]|nr:Transcription factor iws1 [Mortierella sp. GBA43]KAI8352035.1 hypothetical protein B0O80DRAFT_499934 [Mortierella sp. GBAus27b]
MSSDKKRIDRDIFGDDDDDDDNASYSGDRDQAGKSDQEDYQGNAGTDDDKDPAGEEVEEGVPLPSFKKRNADGPEPSREPKKRKSGVKKRSTQDGENVEGGEDLPLDPHQQARLKLEKDFEQALKNGKTSTRRRRKDDEDDTDLDDSASRFITKMREAAFADIDAKLKHQSALSKVRMLDSVKRQLNKSQVHTAFLENGLLEAMKLWLEPLQDASLPSLDIIQDFLDMLDILPIQTLHLVNSGVGRVVYFYTKVDESRVTPAIKRQAHALVDKWSRPIVKLSQDFREKRITYAEEGLTGPQRRRFEAPSAPNPLEVPSTKTLSVRVPQVDRASYALMPESTVTYDKSRGGKNDKYKKLKSHMAKIKQVRRT